MRSCFAAVGWGTLVVAALVLGWFARDDIAGFVSRIAGDDEAPVEAAAPAAASLARGAEEKIIALGQGRSEEITLDAEELNDWIEGGLAGYFPDYISGISAAIEEERLVLTGDVALKEVPGIERLGPVAALLGDTANVTVRGRLDGLELGRGVFYVDDVRVGVLPLPEAARNELLAQMKGGATDDLPANAVVFLLPDFVADVGVRGERVFLRR